MQELLFGNGKVVDDIELIQNQEWKSGLQMEEKLHAELLTFVTKETTFEELYYYMNEFILKMDLLILILWETSGIQL